MSFERILCRPISRIERGITGTFYAIFLFLFTFLTLGVLFGNIGYEYNLLLLFIFVFICAAFSAAVFYLIRKYAERLVKYDAILLILFLCIFFAVQLYLGYRLRFASAFDFAAVYRGAVQWVETGSFQDYYEYYQYFPNNLGAMTFLFLFFKAGRFFGITNYFMLGVLLNSILLSFTMLCSYLVAKKIAGSAGGFLCLYFFMISPPFYILGAAFYTDSLSMLFPVLFYNLYLCLKNGIGLTRMKRKWLYIAMALVITLGAFIKFTVMIMAVAVIIDCLLSGKLQQACMMIAGICACFLVIQVSFHSYLYKYHLDQENAERMNTPLTHWIMMGLNPSSAGAYHPDDYTFTRSFTDMEERNAAILDVIGKRIRENGMDGMTRLFTRKVTKAFGDGTYAISDFLDDGPAERSKIHEYVLYDGKYYARYQYITQSVLITIYLFVIIGASVAFRKGDKSVLALFTAIFGLILFLAMWESSSRYFLNFIPILFLSAVYGGASKSVRFL